MAVLAGQTLRPPPLWMMRQAGRYLPEYRALRARFPSFLDLCYTPEAATEITLQPIRRFGFDAAILFSDILVIPDALGQDVRFVEGEGPRLEPVRNLAAIRRLDPARLDQHLAPVLETVKRVRAALPSTVTLLGFCGAPWTVSTYMIGGAGSPDQREARILAYRDPEAMAALIDLLVDSSVRYLTAQLAAGADAVQIFDTWAGSLGDLAFEQLVIGPTRRIVEGVRRERPGARIIGFPRGAGARLARYAKATGVDAVGLDWMVPLDLVRDQVQPLVPVQGNIDPLALLAGGAALDAAIDHCLGTLGERPMICNLGHGILPQTPIAHVERLVERVRSWS